MSGATLIPGHLFSAELPGTHVDSAALSAELDGLIAARKLQVNAGSLENLRALLEDGPEALPPK